MELRAGTFLWQVFLRAFVSDRGWINWLVRVNPDTLPESQALHKVWYEWKESMTAEERAAWRERKAAAEEAHHLASEQLKRDRYAAAAEANWNLLTHGNLCPSFRKIMAAVVIYHLLFCPLRWIITNLVVRPIRFLGFYLVAVPLYYLIVIPAQFMGTLLGRNVKRLGIAVLVLTVFATSYRISSVVVDNFDDITTWCAMTPERVAQYWAERTKQNRQEEIERLEREAEEAQDKAEQAKHAAQYEAERPRREAEERRQQAEYQRRRKAEEQRRIAEQEQWEREHPEEIKRRAEEQRLYKERLAAEQAHREAYAHEKHMKLLKQGLLYVGVSLLGLTLLVILIAFSSIVSEAFVLLIALPFVYLDGNPRYPRWDRFWGRIDAFWAGCVQVKGFIGAGWKAFHDRICPPNTVIYGPEDEAQVREAINAIRQGKEGPQL